MSIDSLAVCLCQYHVHWNDPMANFATVEELISGLDYDLLTLPEMFSTGFLANPNECIDPTGIKTKKWMDSMSSNSMILGSVPIRDQELFFNRLLAYDNHVLVGSYAKSHTFLGDERSHYSYKKEPVTITKKGWSIGLNICYDLRFPVWTRLYAGNDILFFSANWPKSRIAHWKTLLTARAIENQCYVIGVNRVGLDNNNWEYPGNSMVIDFKGEVLLDTEDQEDSFMVHLDKTSMLEYRKDFPFLEDRDSFQLS